MLHGSFSTLQITERRTVNGKHGQEPKDDEGSQGWLAITRRVRYNMHSHADNKTYATTLWAGEIGFSRKVDIGYLLIGYTLPELSEIGIQSPLKFLDSDGRKRKISRNSHDA